MAKKKNPKVAAAFHEVFHDVPKTVKATGKTGEAKRKMMVAVALSKARAAGAKIPKGGNTELSPDSMKGAALCQDRCDNLATKSEFVGRKRKVTGVKI
jgi:hypothetical protein